MKPTHRLLAASAIVAMLSPMAFAEEPVSVEATPAAPDNAQVQQEEVIVQAVKGQVQVRESADAPWQDAEVGMKVTQGAEFRTGLRSAVRLVIPPDRTITLDRLGTLTVLQAMRNQETNVATTDIGMKYGRTRYQIEGAQQLHDTTIRTTSATLAVRGSDVTVNDSAFGINVSAESSYGVKTNLKQVGQSPTIGKSGMVKVSNENPTPQSQALQDGSVDPQGDFAIQTLVEDSLKENEAGTGGDGYRSVVGVQSAANANPGSSVPQPPSRPED